jgi:hypothetical protein
MGLSAADAYLLRIFLLGALVGLEITLWPTFNFQLFNFQLTIN